MRLKGLDLPVDGRRRCGVEVPQLDLVVTAGVAVQAPEPEQRVYAALELGEPRKESRKSYSGGIRPLRGIHSFI